MNRRRKDEIQEAAMLMRIVNVVMIYLILVGLLVLYATP